MTTDPTLVDTLRELVAAIREYEDPRQASTQWRQALNQLRKTDLDGNRVANVVAMRSIDRLAGLVDELEAPEPEPAPAPDPADRPDARTCRRALGAFKRRLRVTRLDDESRLVSSNPLSKGGGSEIASIQPPREWGPEVWRELERQGKLIHTGDGFYELGSG